jgi:hypothetical protein
LRTSAAGLLRLQGQLVLQLGYFLLGEEDFFGQSALLLEFGLCFQVERGELLLQSQLLLLLLLPARAAASLSLRGKSAHNNSLNRNMQAQWRVLITGTNKGIGNDLVKIFLKRHPQVEVYATSRE